ncbi:hypothetical protein M9458_010224, partial [Cirrhinus mrigala]
SQQTPLRLAKLPPDGSHPRAPRAVHSFHYSGQGEAPACKRNLSRWDSPLESHQKGRSGPRTMLSLAKNGTLSPELLGAERSGKDCTDEASARAVPKQPVQEELGESDRPEGMVRSQSQQVPSDWPNFLHMNTTHQGGVSPGLRGHSVLLMRVPKNKVETSSECPS